MEREAEQAEDREEAKKVRRARVKRLVALGKKGAHKGFCALAPYAAQMGASTAAYTLGINAVQLVGLCLRVSCATLVIGPCLGLLGVGAASAMAGAAASGARRLCEEGGNPLRPRWWRPAKADSALVDAVLGLLVYKTAGGRFSSVMPSDLASPGALAFESIPAAGREYARPTARRELARIFRRDGCHHCGTRRGPVIGDHMPPNKLVFSQGASGQLGAWLGDLPVIRQVRALTGATKGAVRQRYFPQCQSCSIKQATTLRHGKRVLVVHVHIPRHRSDRLTGILAGLRHNVPALKSEGSGSGAQARAHPGTPAAALRWNPVSLTAALAGPHSVPLLTGGASAATVFDGVAPCGGGGGGVDYTMGGLLGGVGGVYEEEEDEQGALVTLTLPVVRDATPPGAARDRYGAAAGGGGAGGGGGLQGAMAPGSGGVVSVSSTGPGAAGSDGGFGRRGAGALGGLSRGAGGAAEGGAISTVAGPGFGRSGGGTAASGGVYGIALGAAGQERQQEQGRAPLEQQPPRLHEPEAAQPQQLLLTQGRHDERQWEAATPAAAPAAAAAAAAARDQRRAPGAQQAVKGAPEIMASFQHWMSPHEAAEAGSGGGAQGEPGSPARHGHHHHRHHGAGHRHGSPAQRQRAPGGGGGSPGGARRGGAAAGPLAAGGADQEPEALKQRAARPTYERAHARGISYD
ncbi:MAG: hypothetical protein J3K34DRAFT_523049 [Monoraphidium minutum]|nr:MAG: hypothetical protein J3K34DRAFT_523049 [Monoraphidium minutum]